MTQADLLEIGQKHQQLALEGRWEECLQLLEGALARFPDDGNLTLLAGLALHELQRHGESIPYFARAAVLMPADELAQLWLGIGLFRAGQLAPALDILELIRGPEWALAYRGLARLAAGVPAGEGDLRRYLLRCSESSLLLTGHERPLVEEAAAALRERGRPLPVPTGEALELLRILEAGGEQELLTRCCEDLPWHHFFRAHALLGLGRSQEAAQAATRALELEPALLDAYRVRGDACSQFDSGLAEADYRRYLEVADPESGPTWGNLGIVLRARKAYAEAVEPLERACELTAAVDYGGFEEHLGMTYLVLGRHQAGVDALTRALARKGGCTPNILFYRGCAYQDLNRHPEARADFENYLRLHPQGACAEQARAALHHKAPVVAAPPPRPGFFGRLFGRGR